MNVESSHGARLSWYSKCYEYLRNRNRISPGNVIIPNSEFFNTGPRRKLRILCPPVQNTVYYDHVNHDKLQSLNDNFFSRWSKRPHPSGNCRCSYRRSGRLSSTEEQLISKEIQRIRTSLCEAEKSGQGIEEIEQSVCLNLENLRTNPPEAAGDADPNEPMSKDKIVKDLEKYINELLEEILNDTVHILAGLDSSLKSTGSVDDRKLAKLEADKGYVNAGFLESACDPATLNFHCQTAESNSDCVDSGINSVNTIELQTEHPSLEQSLMAIIDSKLGESTLDKSLENLNLEIADYGENSLNDVVAKSQTAEQSPERPCDNGLASRAPSAEFSNGKGPKEAERVDDGVQKSRSELTDEEGATCTRNVAAKMNRTVSALREKLVTSLSSKKCQEGKEKASKAQLTELDFVKRYADNDDAKQNLHAITFRKNRKPMIIFLHGFGSSAESFEPQLKYFANLGYPCLAPDMLGHGFSSAPNNSGDYHFDKLLRDLDMILNHYAFQTGQKCVLVGHNYGCSFATSLAAKYENQISQLILISGGGPTPLAPPSSEGIGHCFLRAMLSPFLMCGLHRDILYSARGRQHPYCGPGTKEQWASHMKFVLKGMVWPNGDYAFHRRISTPALLIHGLRDNSVSLVQECQMERTMIKALLEAIPTAGHMPMTECADQLNHMIHCFIDLWKNKR